MNQATEQPDRQTTPKRLPFGRIALAIAGIGILVYSGRAAGAYLQDFASWIDGLGFWGPVAFIVGYAVATVAFVPGSILTLTAGAIFGVPKGTVFVFIAAVLGSAAAFLVARYLARGVIEQRIAGNKKFAAIDRAIAGQGFKIVLMLRLSPAFPFTLLNYGLGLTRVRFVDYLAASIGMLPGTLLYVYYGGLVGEVAQLAGGASIEKGAGYYTVLGLGLVATIVVTTLVTRVARRALAEATGESR